MGSSGTARVAAIITCHNRRDETLRCLRALRGQRAAGAGAFAVQAYVLDAASSDGTADAVAREFPGVRVIAGSGDLYWAGGMRAAMEAALREGFDFYLWVNDDTALEPDAVATLLATSARVSGGRHDAIVVGSIRDPATGGISYGGVARATRFRPLHFDRVAPGPEPRRCHTMNANCVLVPASVVAVLGNLDPAYPHGIADFDYGLRATRKGIAVWNTPSFVGTCVLNTGTAPWRDRALPVRARWKLLLREKGLPPRAWATFTWRHGGSLWLPYFAAPYLKLALSSVTSTLARLLGRGALAGEGRRR